MNFFKNNCWSIFLFGMVGGLLFMQSNTCITGNFLE